MKIDPWRSSVSVLLVGGRHPSHVSVLQSVAVALQVDDFGVVHEPVDHRRGDHGVAEDLAPAPKGLVRGDDDAGPLVTGRDQLEEQVGGLAVEGDVADFVDHEEGDAPEPGELGVESSLLMGFAEPGDPLRRSGKGDAVPRLAGPDAETNREVGLAGPGGPRKTTLSFASTKSSVPRCAATSRRSER